MFFGPAIWIDGFANLDIFQYHTINLLGPGQHVNVIMETVKGGGGFQCNLEEGSEDVVKGLGLVVEVDDEEGEGEGYDDYDDFDDYDDYDDFNDDFDHD